MRFLENCKVFRPKEAGLSDFTDFSEGAGITKKPHILCTLNEINICRPNNQLKAFPAYKVTFKDLQNMVQSQLLLRLKQTHNESLYSFI